jgi:hypothetical protein
MLAFVEVCYKNRNPRFINHMLKRVSIIRKYIIDDNDKRNVIRAVQLFMWHVNDDVTDNKSENMFILDSFIQRIYLIGQTMEVILQFFLKQQCINNEILLKWYYKGDQGCFVGYNEAKQNAQAFIERLQSTTATTV